MNLSTLILHPFLFFLAPFIILFAGTQHSSIVRSYFSPAFAVLAALQLFAIVAAGLLLGRLINDRRKAFLAVSAVKVTLSFCAFIHNTFFAQALISGSRLSAWDGLVPFLAALLPALALLWVFKFLKDTAAATRFFNIFALCLFFSSIISAGLQFSAPRPEAPASPAAHPVPQLKAGAGAPDIYHIICDGYTDSAAMRKYYGLDLRPFENALENRGLRVIRDVTADYPSTEYSLASVLNMRYLPPGLTITEAGRMLRESSVSAALKSAGYRYIYITAGMLPQRNVFADSTPVYDRYPLHFAMLRMSPLLFYYDSYMYGQISYSFTAFAEAARLPGPKLVVFYISLPHPPYLFAADGSMTPAALRGDFDWENREGYTAQVAYTNSELLRALAGIEKNPSGRKAVIIIHSDHGTRGAAKTEAERRKRKLEIFCAMRLPGKIPPPPGFAPANLYRVIFNEYFGARLPLLEKRPWRNHTKGGRSEDL